MKKSMETDLKHWQDFTDRRVPMAIKSIPKNELGNEWIVVPKEAESFWMGDFDTRESALKFCTNNGLPVVGKLWWIADNQQELDEWKKNWEGNPIKVVGVDTNGHDGSDRLNVIFELEIGKATELLGYEVEDEEWLEE